eukprot:gb/GECH01014720.1/.p1 GENE.gb/GECH01014720.1/~~gb/GECH01014720.1/.p1  ORF type:complete len:605 (+),score=181.74 gb/GECH01014720.1/:1-1815(+)
MKLFGTQPEEEGEQENKEFLTRKGEDHKFFITNVHNTLNKEIASLIGKPESSVVGSEEAIQETPEQAPSVQNEPETAEERENVEQPSAVDSSEAVTMDESELSLVIDSIDMKEFSNMIQSIWTNGHSPITFRNTLKIMDAPGREKYKDMYRLIETAKNHIHIEYSVNKDRSLNSQLVDLLARKAAAGVSIRLLYHGKHSGLNRKIKKKWSNVPVNYHPLESPRNVSKLLKRVGQKSTKPARRKFVIVDGQYGFVGEMNFSDDQFSNDKESFLQICGDSVNILQGLFCDDWELHTGQSLREYQRYPSPFYPEAQHIDTDRLIPLQTLITTPEHSQQFSFVQHVLPTLIRSAQHSVYIGMPLFHPYEGMLTALKESALADKDVRLLVQGTKEFPGVSSKIQPISEELVQDLLQCKIKIHRYDQGSLKSKMIIVDHKISVIGTMDINVKTKSSSIELNNIIYDERMAEELENVFWADTLGGEEARLPSETTPSSTRPHQLPESREEPRETSQTQQAPTEESHETQEQRTERREEQQQPERQEGETVEQEREPSIPLQQEQQEQRPEGEREEESREREEEEEGHRQDTKKKKRGIVSKIFRKKKKTQA